MYINVSTESSITNKGHGLLEEWNYEKNGNLKPDIINIHSNQKVWWKCPKGHEWRETPHSRIDKEGFSKCPYCSGRIAIKGVNDLKTVNPKFLQEWNYKKNGTLSPSDFMKYSNIKVWWKCKKGHEWQQKISNRNYNGCPYCANLKVLIGYNDLSTTNPQIAKEWNYEKNKNLKPSDVIAGSGKKVWWKCEKNHEWQASILNRTSKHSGCPYCRGNIAREVEQYDLNGNLIKKYKSINQAKNETGILKISEVCCGKRKNAGGFFWKYVN